MAENTFEIEITGMNQEGQGVGRIDGKAVFVNGALPGETVEAQIAVSKKSYATADMVRVIRKSEDRVDPFCETYDECGGCNLQHMDYKAQLLLKSELVSENLRRIGKIENVSVNKTIGMEKPFNYRNKAQFPVGIKEGKPVCGFYAKRTHDICNVLECTIQNPQSLAVNEAVKEFIRQYKIRVYEEAKGTGLVRHVITRVGFKTGEVMVILVINGDELPYKDELIEILNEKVPGLTSVYVNINKKNTNIIFGKKSVKIFGEDKIRDLIGKFEFKISLTSFFQVNPIQTEVMYGKVLEYAALTGNETVLDIYCGIGTISIFLAENAKKVYGVEVVPEAIRDAKRNARLNNAENVEFIKGEAETAIPMMKEKGIEPDVIVVDPPRKGVDESVLAAIAEMSPKRIIYVSCNPATLARDLRYLEDRGYRTNEVQPIDMFPWTGHVESVVLMSRVDSE